MAEVDKKAIYEQVKETAWCLFVFRRTPQTEVGYGRLNCECPNLGKFIESYTADVGDDEADGYDAEKEAAQEEEEEEESSSNEEEESGSKKRKQKTRINRKAKKNPAWRDEQDRAWIKDLFERPNAQFIYQLPHLQTQTVCFGGLTKFRITLLREIQKAGKLFKYERPIFSGSPAGILEDFVMHSVPHGLTNQLDPFVWEHYCTPVNEALCVFWDYCPLKLFDVIPCGHAPGETFQGKATQLCQENLLKVRGDWRQQLAMATKLCMKHDFNADNLADFRDVLKASYPLKLVYVSDTGFLRHAKNLEACRAKLMNIANEAAYPLNPQEDNYECDYELECDDEDDNDEKENKKKLDIARLPPSISAVQMAYPNWLDFISTGGGPKQLEYECELCPRETWNKIPSKVFASWQDYVSNKWEHMCCEHGPLGANCALTNVPNWILTYVYKNTSVETCSPVFKAMSEVGFREYGYEEQGSWKALPGSGFFSVV